MTTLRRLDRGGREPLYRQIRLALQEDIANGHFGEDGRLPSSRTLAHEFGVSRNVVNLAYQELITEGYVSSKERSGLFVNAEMQAYLRRTSKRPDDDAVDRPNWADLIQEPSGDWLEPVDRPLDWSRFRYPFVGGQIDLVSFPVRSWLRALSGALAEPHRRFSLQDSQYADDPLLVDVLCNSILPARGITATADEVLVVAGSQQGLSLLADAVGEQQCRVAVEDPGYPDVTHIFLRAGKTIVPVPVDAAGLQLSPALRQCRIICITPSHQFPTNVTLSIARREQLLKLAMESDAVLVEDDYDSEYRYHGRAAPALKAMDSAGRVVYLGSFSKFLAPGLRLGYVVADPALIASLRERRRYAMRHPPGHLQRALALLIQSGDYSRGMRHTRALLKTKWETIVHAAQAWLPCTFEVPTGGTSLWLAGPDDMDAAALARAAAERGILIEPEAAFRIASGGARNHFRLAYSAIAVEAIQPGVQALGEVVRAHVARGGSDTTGPT